MKILTAEKDSCLLVRITGEIDHHTAPEIRQEIDGELERLRPEKLILDLGQTDFMDSSGLGLILGRMRKTEEMQVNFTLLNPSPSILKILRFAGVEKKLEIEYL